MEVDFDLFQRLVNANAISRQQAQVITEHQPGDISENVVLDRDTTAHLENGVIVARYLEYTITAMEHEKIATNDADVTKLRQMKEANTAQTKLSNWSVIFKEVEKLGIPIDSDLRGLVIAGDLDMISELLKRISELTGDKEMFSPQDEKNEKESSKNVFNDKKQSVRKKRVKEGVDILSMDPNKKPTKCDSSLEIILNTLCRNFKMKPKQCAALLTNNNQYLMHSVVKGLKGNFEPVISWFEELNSIAEYFAEIICLESKKNKKHNTLTMAMNAVKTGCFSHNYEVAQWCLRFITKMAYEFEDSICADALYEWLINSTQEGGIRAILYVLRRHSDLIEAVVNCLIQFAKGSLIDILKELMRSLYPSPLEYVAIVNDFTHVLVENKEYRDEMLASGLIDYWLEMSVRQADNDGTHSPEERTVAITFLADLWLFFPDKLYQREDLASQILKVFKRASRDKFRPLRLSALSQMFRLLEIFSRTKNSNAPSIYKALAMSLVENHSDSTTREYIIQNMEQIFESQPTIPVGFVVEPLVNQLQMAEGISYHYNSIDFQFFVVIAKHPKLHAQQAIPLIDILAKIYLNDQAYAQCCSKPLMMLITRFINDHGVGEFLVKFLTVSLSMLLALEKGKGSKKVKIPTTMNINAKPKAAKETKEEKEVNRALKKTFIIEIARKIQKLRHAYVNSQMKNLVLSTNKRNNEIHGNDNVGCLVLLKFWGDPKSLIEEFMKEETEREKKLAEEQEKNQQLVLADDIDPGNASAIEGVNNRSSMEIVPYNDDYGNNRMSRDSKRGQLIPWIKKQPKGKIGRKAMHEIERLQKTRKDREEFRKLQSKQLRMRDERSKRRLKDELEKRKIEYGVNSMNKSDAERKIIFDEGEVEKFKLQEKKHGLPEIELFDFEEEEQRDVDAIKIFMKKYAKLWKFYFNKYANMCFSAKSIKNFDQLNDKHNTINLAELLKLLKDHDFDKRYITKEELAAIIRLVNFKKIKKSDLTAMNYPGFLEWIIQTALYIFTKPPEDKSHFPPVECLHSFLRKLEKGQKDKGASTILFEDPDATTVGDATLLNALNKKIKEDPNYPLPEDYKKVKEKEMIYDYKLPDYIPISENKKFAMELLDDLIFDKFQFHFLEPIISYKETVKVKPIIRRQFKNENEGRNTPRYLQSLDKRTKPKELTDKGKMSSYQKMRQNKQRTPKLREVLALEVAKFSKEDRGHAQETAEALEEILLAAEKGYKELPNREKYGPMGMKNPVIEENEKKRKEERKLRKEKELQRKKRDDFVKEKIKKKEEAKKKMLEETKDDRKRQREAKKKKKEELKAQKEKERNERQKEYEEKKEKAREELERKQKEDEEKEKAKKDKFEKENKAFLKEQAKKIRKNFKETIQEKKSIQQAEKEYEEMSQKLKEDMKKKMEKYFEENKENLKKDKEEKQAINKFMKNKQVAAVFNNYDSQLKYFFDYYAKSDHHDLTRDIEKQFETVNYKEFIKFGYESNIIPTIIPIHEIIYIFHQLVRERNDEDPSSEQTLDYEYFKKALVRISAVGQAILGGQNAPKFEKKMEELKEKDEQDKKRKEKLAKKFSVMSPKKLTQKKTNKSEKDDIERDDNSDTEKRDAKKLDMRKEGSLVERGAKPPRQKIVIPNPKEEKLKSATLLKGKLDSSLLLNKKSSSINKLYEIDNKAQVVEHLKNVKVDNTRVTTECDVSIISDKTIEALLRHIGLDPVQSEGEKQKLTQELRFAMDKKLSSRKMDVQGAKPNREKLKNLPEKADLLSNFDDAVSEEEDGEDSEDDATNKKDKKKDDKKKEKDNESEDEKASKKQFESLNSYQTNYNMI